MTYSWDDDWTNRTTTPRAPLTPTAPPLPALTTPSFQPLITNRASNVLSGHDSPGPAPGPPAQGWTPGDGSILRSGQPQPPPKTTTTTTPPPTTPPPKTKPTQRFPPDKRPPKVDPKSTWDDDWWDGQSDYLGGWLVREADNPINKDHSVRTLTRTLAADGHQVKSTGFDRLMIDGRPYKVAGPPTNPAWTPSFAPGQAPYTPGAIPFDDLQGYSFADMMQKLQTSQDPMLDSLIGGILKNPESLSPLMVDTLKAKSADELAGIAEAQKSELGRYGWLTGNQDSNWLASEHLANQRGRDQALIGSNRNIEIEAARTNMEDRRRAAGVGLASTAEKRMRATLAADTSLRAATITGDRLALREAVKQKAAELQLDADQLMQHYVVAQMEDLTKRYGIQVAADIDITRLSLQSQQFKEDLAFKLTELGMGWAKFVATNKNT